MHNYSINKEDRIKIFFMLALISIFSVGLMKEWLICFFNHSLYISAPSAFAVYGLLHIIFSKCGWKIPPSTWGLVNTPIVEGKWTGQLKSSLDEFKIAHDITINIHQTWDKISICLDGETAKSESKMANFRIINPSLCEFEWGFICSNKPEFAAEQYIYHGVAIVELSLTSRNKVLDKIEGKYFTDKGTVAFGSISLKRVSECPLNV